MASVLLQTEEEPVTVSAKDLRLLLDRGDGDAALLYLALKRRRNQDGGASPRLVREELRWEKKRLEQAEQVLRELELAAPAASEVPEEDEAGRPSYQRSDIAAQLEGDAVFRNLTGQVEQRLGKRLSERDLERLLRLYDHACLPPDVIYLLVCHCMEKTAAHSGNGRTPHMWQIEREGYAWARRGTDTQTAAADYLKRYARREETFAGYMRVLHLGDRLPVASEERYMAMWQEWGFPAETVALAYDRTVFRCHEFKWGYCNGILRRWHKSGFHTAVEVESGDHKGTGRNFAAEFATNDEIRKYAQELLQSRGE